MDRRRLAVFLSFTALGVVMACNDHDPHPPNTTDPGNGAVGVVGGGGGSSGTTTDGGGVIDTGTDANAECTDLDDPTTVIDEDAVSDAAPVAGLGGAPITDGIYDLTTAQRYVGVSGQAGPNGVSYREVIRLSGGNLLERNRISQQDTGPLIPLNISYVLQVSGTNVLLTQKCPALGTTESFAFTFQDGRLTLVGASGESFTYTIRP